MNCLFYIRMIWELKFLNIQWISNLISRIVYESSKVSAICLAFSAFCKMLCKCMYYVYDYYPYVWQDSWINYVLQSYNIIICFMQTKLQEAQTNSRQLWKELKFLKKELYSREEVCCAFYAQLFHTSICTCPTCR